MLYWFIFFQTEENNDDIDCFQFMSLPMLGIVITKFHKQLPEKYQYLNSYRKKFENVYRKVRNKVMHAVRPILSDKNSINQLDTLLTDYYEIKKNNR